MSQDVLNVEVQQHPDTTMRLAATVWCYCVYGIMSWVGGWGVGGGGDVRWGGGWGAGEGGLVQDQSPTTCLPAPQGVGHARSPAVDRTQPPPPPPNLHPIL